jgi:hypothetical protein
VAPLVPPLVLPLVLPLVPPLVPPLVLPLVQPLVPPVMMLLVDHHSYGAVMRTWAGRSRAHLITDAAMRHCCLPGGSSQ